MKRLIISCVISFIISQSLTAQEILPEGQFKSLQLNSSPAYVILGVEPENIQRPNSPTEFAAGVQSALVNGILQPNFALETTPYYWRKKKESKIKFDPLNYVTNDHYWENLAKSISFSLASSPSDTFTFGNIPKGTGVGLGLHLQLVEGKVSKNVTENLLHYFYSTRAQLILEEALAVLENGDNIDGFELWIEDLFEEGNAYKTMPDKEKNEIRVLLERKIRKSDLTVSDTSLIRGIRDELIVKSQSALIPVNERQFPLTREGFMLEVAIANAQIISDNNWDSMNNAKTSVWLTPSYRINVNKDPTVIDIVDLMAVARATFNNSKVDSSDYYDFGAKLQWIHNKISFSGEFIYRLATQKPPDQDKNFTYKTGLTFSYKLNNAVTFKTTFGSNFDGNSTIYDDPQALMIVGGVNFGISGFTSGNNQ